MPQSNVYTNNQISGLLVVGSCLMAVAAYIYPWTAPVDSTAAGLNVAQIPTSEVRAGAESLVRVRIPDSEQWRKLISKWGAPKFIAAVRSRAARPELACFPQTGLGITLTDLAGHTIPTSPTAAAPYGYTSQCAMAGVEFIAAPGSELLLHVTRSGNQAEAQGELIIMPSWPYEKDRLVGDMITPYLTRLALVIGGVGICCLGGCLWLYRRQIVARREDSSSLGSPRVS